MRNVSARFLASVFLLGTVLLCAAFQEAAESSDTWQAAARRCHGIGAALFALMGLVYLGRRRFMPYHEQAVGKPWEDLTPSERVLFLASMRIIGSAWLGLAVALGLMIRHGLKSGSPWAVLGVPSVGLLVAVPTLIAVLAVKRGTPARPPWPPLAVATALFLAGLLCSLMAGGER